VERGATGIVLGAFRVSVSRRWCISVNLFTIPPAGPPSPPRAPRRRGVRRAVQVDLVYARRRVELHVEARAAPFAPEL
jgi:hypothetical protein